MQFPRELKPALWGAVGGAAALAIIGFSWGGWVTGGTAERLAKQRASTAVVAALAPICVDNFQRDKDAPAQLVELKKVSSWEQAAFVSKGGWATMPGTASVDTAMARACAEMILAIKP
jgi:alpha/beta superfamily hydrolase